MKQMEENNILLLVTVTILSNTIIAQIDLIKIIRVRYIDFRVTITGGGKGNLSAIG